MVIAHTDSNSVTLWCPQCPAAQQNWDSWMGHLADQHPLPDEWLSEKVCRLHGEAALKPYTYITESKKKRKKDYIPRPLNSFMIFARHMRRSILEVFGEASNSDISKQLGEVWRTLPNNVKNQYNNEANKLAKIHLKEFPNYKYQPKKKCTTKANSSPATVRTVTDQSRGNVSSQLSVRQQHLPPQRSSIVSHSQTIQYRNFTLHSNHTKASHVQQSSLPKLHGKTANIIPMFPLKIKTEDIDFDGQKWAGYQITSSTNTSGQGLSPQDLPSPSSSAKPMPMISSVNTCSTPNGLPVLNPAPSIACGSQGSASQSPEDIAQTCVTSSFVNYDYFSHLNDCSGLSGLNLDTITFGDLHRSESFNEVLNEVYSKDEDDFKEIALLKEETAQTPSSTFSDDVFNILPSSAFSGCDDVSLGHLDTHFPFTDQLPSLTSWAGLRV